jgi:L-ascorbate metabolism protein UlaG (beta-lactamase superfamily)
MIISYQGAECFKISQGDITLALNPISKPARPDARLNDTVGQDSGHSGGDSKFKPSRFGADITLITTNLPDFNGRDQTSRGDKSSFVIDGPGEYEIKDVFIKGFLSVGPAKKINTIYLISFEGMNLCFLGALSDANLPPETLEAIEDIDILFVPIGSDTLDPASAYKLAVSLEPSVIIPMYYTKATLEQFLKEGGEDKVEPLDKFVVKKKDLDGKEGEIVVLKEE